MQGHRDHWECLLGDLTAETFMNTEMKKIFDASEPYDVTNWPDTVFYGHTVNHLLTMKQDAGPIQCMSLVFISELSKANLFASAYPIAAEGVEHDIEITNITPWDHGIEGTIEGATKGGALISFFDPYFFKNKEKYEIGETYTFNIAGFAYNLGKPNSPDIEITEGPLIEIALAEGTITSPDEPVLISTDKMKALFPREEWGEGEYSFQGSIQQVKTTKYGDRVLKVIKTTVMCPIDEDDEEFDFNIVIYAAEHALEEGCYLAANEYVAGGVWLQGCLV